MTQGDSCNIHLPDGRCVDVCTRYGADAFLQDGTGEFEFFRFNIGDINKIREKSRKKKKGRLSAAEKMRLETVYFTTYSLAQNSTPEIFAAKVPKEEIEIWMGHVITEIKEMTKDKKWIQTGTLQQHDAFLLNSCISMFQHAVPVSLAFEMDFLKTLSEFLGARSPPLLPCPDIADTVELIIGHIVISTSFDGTGTSGNAEKTFKKLESSGMLAQFLRCTTVPQEQDRVQISICVCKTYEELIKCNTFIRKKIMKGEQCGDVLKNILNGTDGSKKRRPKVIAYLQTIASYTDLMQNRKENMQFEEGFRICRHCNKSDTSSEFQGSLKSCARCKSAYYCSRECQKADWKDHKTQCTPVTKADIKSSNASEQTLLNWAQRNYITIMAELVKISDKTGLGKSELLLELDFMPDESGSAPALRKPPEFKIAETRGYFEGSRHNEPDWFYKNQDRECYENNIKNIVPVVKDLFGRLTENHLLCLVRHPGSHSCYRLQLHTNIGVQMFSNTALDAFKSVIHCNDSGPLKLIFDQTQVRQIENTLRMMGLVMPSEEKMDEVRRMLNMMGGDFPLSSDMP